MHVYVGSILLYFAFFCVGLVDFDVNFFSVPVQVIAWRTVSDMTYNVSNGTLNLTHSVTHAGFAWHVWKLCYSVHVLACDTRDTC